MNYINNRRIILFGKMRKLIQITHTQELDQCCYVFKLASITVPFKSLKSLKLVSDTDNNTLLQNLL